MEAPFHRFADLFAQLGLPADNAGIAAFIGRHAPLRGDLHLADAPFWSPAQAQLLRETLCADADWAEVVDLLSVRLEG